MRRRTTGRVEGWPDDGLERLDLQTLFSSGEPEINLPPGWTLERARRVWLSVADEFDEDCWAAREWGLR